MAYIDGFVAAVPKANKEAYREHARLCAQSFKAHGALSLVESWGDDVPDGKLTSFPLAVQCKADEAVVFSWIVWPSRAVRDEAWKQLMDDPNMKPDRMPFDAKRMIYGGFEELLTA